MTVDKYLEQWLSDYCETRLAENTIRGYRVNINKHIIPYIGGIALDSLQPSDVQRMYTRLLGTGLSTTTVLYVHAVIRRALNCAQRQRLVSENIVNCVYPPRRTKYRGDILPGADLVKLVAACEDTDIFISVLLGVSLGLRRGEALGLKWSDIDFKENVIHIQRTASFYAGQGMVLGDPKSDTSNRSLLVSHYVMCHLLGHYEAQRRGRAVNPLGLVNLAASGVPLTSYRLAREFRRILDRAGLPRIRFHDLRHSNATLMLKNKVPAKIVSSMLGHSNIGITLDLYSHVLTDMQEPAVQVIDNLFA